MTTNTSELPVGTVLQNDQIVSVLGLGRFGITCFARDRRRDRKVAIREYTPSVHAHRDSMLRIVASPGLAPSDVSGRVPAGPCTE